MSELPSNESLQSKKINQREYNFEEEMEQLEVSMISLVLQLKDAIVEGDYSSFLSDDTGGRMPTLILKYITKKNKEVKNFIKKINFGDKKILIITQFIDSGNTLKSIGAILKDEGTNIKNDFDFASLDIELNPDIDLNEIPWIQKQLKDQFGSKLFIGHKHDTAMFMRSRHGNLSGIKRTDYSPVPKVSESSYNNIIKTRQDLKLMAEKIVEKVWPELK